MLRQDRQFTETHDQQRIVWLLEDEADAVPVENVDALNPLQVGAVARMPVLEQQPVGECHVIGGDRLAIMEASFLAQVENDPAIVVAVLHRFGDQPVAGRRFVARRVVDAGTDHQRFVQLAEAVLQESRGRTWAGALECIGVQRIERTRRHQLDPAALGRARIHPVEVGEIGWVLKSAELRITMAFADGGEGGKAQGQAGQ